MTENIIEILTENDSAQDLFFIEKDVLGTKVVEKPTPTGTTAFGMPGILEAVIIVSTVSAAAGALMWLLKKRDRTKIKIRQRTSPDGTVEQEFDLDVSHSETPETLLQKVDQVLKILAGAASGLA